MIILIAGEKGGSGKSTVATNLATGLALAGRDVLLLDADPQRTSALWVERRDEAGISPRVHCAEKTGDLKQSVADLASRYEDVVIDAGGRDSRELRSGLLVAQRAYVPMRPSQADLETSPHVDELVGMAKSMRVDSGPAAFILLTMAPTHHLVTETQQAQAVLKNLPSLSLASPIIRERKIYRDALAEGRGVLEMNNAAAIAECRALLEDVTHG
jgi:chromosome partitioning protein